jgi:hypothetical protein
MTSLPTALRVERLPHKGSFDFVQLSSAPTSSSIYRTCRSSLSSTVHLLAPFPPRPSIGRWRHHCQHQGLSRRHRALPSPHHCWADTVSPLSTPPCPAHSPSPTSTRAAAAAAPSVRVVSGCRAAARAPRVVTARACPTTCRGHGPAGLLWPLGQSHSSRPWAKTIPGTVPAYIHYPKSVFWFKNPRNSF